MRNRNGIFWGLFLLLSAAILVVSQLHLITYTFSFWTIVATIFLAAVLIKSLVYFAIPGTVFSLAFLAILYAKPLGIMALTPWTILEAALLISIGLSLIFRPLLAKKRPWIYHHGNTIGHRDPFVSFNYTADPDEETIDTPDVDVRVKMSNSIRYVKSDDFKRADIDVSMGEAKVYFENVSVIDSAVINVNVSLSGLELYVPKNWDVREEIDNNMGSISEVGVSNVTVDSPSVVILGGISLSGLKINYI